VRRPRDRPRRCAARACRGPRRGRCRRPRLVRRSRGLRTASSPCRCSWPSSASSSDPRGGLRAAGFPR
jgi:hypothetical protein